MVIHLTVVSEQSVEKIRDEGELDAFFNENPAARVSAEPPFCAEGSQLTPFFKEPFAVV